jgi:hypothetical protein
MVMQLKGAAWVAVITFLVLMLLQFARLFNVIGSEYDLLIRWISTISLVLIGVFVGILISKKKIPISDALISLVLTIFGFLLIPTVIVVAAPIVNTFPLTLEAKVAITGILSTGVLFLYMGFLFWLRKKGILKVGKTLD